jgi:hypothetical protein
MVPLIPSMSGIKVLFSSRSFFINYSSFHFRLQMYIIDLFMYIIDYSLRFMSGHFGICKVVFCFNFPFLSFLVPNLITF